MFPDLSYGMEQVLGLHYVTVFLNYVYCQNSVGAFGSSFTLEDR